MWRMAQSRSSSTTNITAENEALTAENEALTAEEQRQLTIDENYWRGIVGQVPRPLVSETPRRKHRLNQALVNILPSRIYKEKEFMEAETKEGESVSEKSANIKNVSVDSFGTTCELSSCVICLDSFATGDILRCLPCNHEYHRDCIGKYKNQNTIK
jgi:hypothetical protein